MNADNLYTKLKAAAAGDRDEATAINHAWDRGLSLSTLVEALNMAERDFSLKKW